MKPGEFEADGRLWSPTQFTLPGRCVHALDRIASQIDEEHRPTLQELLVALVLQASVDEIAPAADSG